MHLGGNGRWVPLFIIAPLSGTSACGARDADKLEALNKRTLYSCTWRSLVLVSSQYSTLLTLKVNRLLRCVTLARSVSLYCCIRVCFSLFFLLISKICFYPNPPLMIFVTTTFYHSVICKTTISGLRCLFRYSFSKTLPIFYIRGVTKQSNAVTSNE